MVRSRKELCSTNGPAEFGGNGGVSPRFPAARGSSGFDWEGVNLSCGTRGDYGVSDEVRDGLLGFRVASVNWIDRWRGCDCNPNYGRKPTFLFEREGGWVIVIHTMKIYKVFTASTTEGAARDLCARFNPFGSPRVAWFGFYEERGWEFVPAGREYVPGRVYCEDMTKPELELLWIERNLRCSDGVGDLMSWRKIGAPEVFYSIVYYMGVAERISAGCFVLSPADEESGDRIRKNAMPRRRLTDRT